MSAHRRSSGAGTARAGCLLVAAAAGVFAADGPAADATAPPGDTAVQEKLVVTASRFEQPIDEVPTHVTVLSSEDIASSGAVTVDDALRQTPGFSLFRRTGSVVAQPTTQGVSLRGIGPSGVSRTLVLLDGAPLNDPFGGWVYWSRVSREALERVEIVRGGGSSAWGSAALGGVIQLLTARPEADRLRLLAEAGERGTGQLDLSWSDRGDRVGYRLHGNLFDTDGYPVVRADQRGAIDVAATSEHAALDGRVDVGFGESWSWSGRIEAFDEERGNGTPLTFNDTRLVSTVHTVERATGRGSWIGRLLVQDQEFAATFSAQAGDRSSESPSLDQFLVDTESLGGTLQWTGLVGRHTVAGGAETRTTEGATHEDFRFVDGAFLNRRRAGGDELLGGLWVQDSVALGERVTLSLGGRFDLWRTEDGVRLERVIADGTVLRDDALQDREESDFSPRVGVVWEAADRWQLLGSLYRSFRAPTINELYRPFRVRNDITEANAELDPETLEGGEVGVRYAGSRLRWSAYAFLDDLDDPISNVTVGLGPGQVAPCGFVPGGGSCRQRQNLGSVRVEGLELDLFVRASDRITLNAAWVHSESEVRAAPSQPELVGRALAQAPENVLSVTPRFELGRAGLSLTARWTDEQFDDDLNERALDEATVVDAFLRLRVGAAWDLFAAAENLLDQRVEAGLTGDGLVSIAAPRLLRLGVRWSPQ
ncbi:MAG TPA: TonB-dependent receptor [Thermoanaerobaculia bacterium]|nr:TonB-dependent receptor [Thermoanaerobaculia bacterium]